MTHFENEMIWPDMVSIGLACDRFPSASGEAPHVSVRRVDADGRLHVASTPISKANICPYRGQEIPDWQRLKLDPERIYHLLRDPNELSKAADSFNALPILETHHPVTAQDPRRDLVIGATGKEATFEAPFLTNSLVIWDGSVIERIQSGQQRELSCAYAYVPVMMPGTCNGQRYDGVMTHIRGSHVALVSKGRAGPDVLVADASPFCSPTACLPEREYMTDRPSGQGHIQPPVLPESRKHPEKPKETLLPSSVDQETDIARAEDDPSIEERIRLAVEAALAAERKRHKDADEARRSVRPLVGDVIGMDSAEEIYRYALGQSGIDAKAIHTSALAGMVSLVLHHTPLTLTSPSGRAMDATPADTMFGTPAPRKL